MIIALIGPSAAQARDVPQHVLLARTCLREAGWAVTDDCAAIHAVILDRVSITKARYSFVIQAYSRPRPTRAWVDGMTAEATKPVGWPKSLSWSAYQDQWRALLAHAQAVISSDVKPACKAHHWGDSRSDRKRALQYGWAQVPCGNALNEFWVTRRVSLPQFCADKWCGPFMQASNPLPPRQALPESLPQ